MALLENQQKAQRVKQAKEEKKEEKTNRTIQAAADVEANPAEVKIELPQVDKEKSQGEIEEEGQIPDEGIPANPASPKAPTHEEMLNVFNPVLYTRGIDSDAFHLILSGKVTVCSGNEGFMIT